MRILAQAEQAVLESRLLLVVGGNGSAVRAGKGGAEHRRALLANVMTPMWKWWKSRSTMTTKKKMIGEVKDALGPEPRLVPAGLAVGLHQLFQLLSLPEEFSC